MYLNKTNKTIITVLQHYKFLTFKVKLFIFSNWNSLVLSVKQSEFHDMQKMGLYGAILSPPTHGHHFPQAMNYTE